MDLVSCVPMTAVFLLQLWYADGRAESCSHDSFVGRVVLWALEHMLDIRRCHGTTCQCCMNRRGRSEIGMM